MQDASAPVKADLENGYSRLANTLVEAICSADLSGRQFRVFMAVVRKTYGFNQKSDYLTASQIAEVMEYDGAETNIRADIRTLKQRKMITCKGRYIGPNPVVSEWIKGKPADQNRSEKGLKTIPKQIENNLQTDQNQSPKEIKNDPITDQKQSVLTQGTGSIGGLKSIPKQIENDLGGDRKRSVKQIENDPHKRQKTLIQNTNTKNTPSESEIEGEGKTRQPKFTAEHFDLATRLAEPVMRRYPTQKIDLEQWADAIRKLIELDNRPQSEILPLWIWITNHDRQGFSWAANCRTPMKLRERDGQGLPYWDVIQGQRQRETQTPAKAAALHSFDNVNYDYGTTDDGRF